MKTVRAWCAAVVFVSIGCGGGGGGGGTTTSAEFCMQYATDVCGIAPSCAIQQSACVSFQLGQCNTFAAAAVAGGVRVFTPGNINDCLNKVKAAYTGTTVITPTMLSDIDRLCNYVWQGKVAQLTGACTTSYDCAGATDGSIVCDATQHLCASKTTVSGTGTSAQCGAVGAVCAQDSYCAANMAGISICMASAKSGDVCTTVPCDHSSRCVNGTCAALGQSGDSCTASSDCMTSAPYCNPFGPSPVCSLGLQFATLSPSCTCIGQGMGCPAGWTGMGAPSGTASPIMTGAAGHSGGGGTGGGAGGAAGHAAGGAGGGAAGAAGSGAAGSGAAGAAGSGAAGAGGLGGI